MKGACKVFLVFYQLVRSYWKIICFQFKIHLQFIDFQLQCIYFINQLVFLFQSIESETSVKFKMYSKLILFSFNGKLSTREEKQNFNYYQNTLFFFSN